MAIKISTAKIKKEWTDYNGHMNVAYYILIFDQNAAETLMTKLDMGEKSALETNKSTMVVESHITYNQELIEGDEVELNLIHFDHDKKRIQYKFEMVHKEKKYLASTIEVLALYVDLKERKRPKYTPLSKRQDRPDAILWLCKNASELTDGQISKLVGSTKGTVSLIRKRSYWNFSNLKPRDPVILALCTQEAFQKALDKAKRRIEREKKAKIREEKKAQAASV